MTGPQRWWLLGLTMYVGGIAEPVGTMDLIFQLVGSVTVICAIAADIIQRWRA